MSFGPESRELRKAKEFITPSLLFKVGAPVGGLAVFGLGFYEGWLRSNDVGYSFAYAASNMLPSIVWYRIPPETIAEAIQYSPSLLRDLKAETAAEIITNAQAAKEAILIDNIYALRSGIAGSVVLGYVLSGINAVRNAGERMRSRILKGDQLMTAKDESIFFLGGEQSSVMEALTQSNQPTLPILESEEAASVLLGGLPPGKRAEKPFYIRVHRGRYEEAKFAERISLSTSSLIPKDNGDQMLIVVGDGSVYEEEFPFRHENQQDLNIKELQTAAKELAEVAKSKGADNVQVVRIYLGDAYHQTPTGRQENTISLRGEMEKYSSVEVLIDSQGPLIEKVINWLDGRREVVFHTKQQDYFSATAKMLQGYGVIVYDQGDENIADNTPVLVYEETTAATVLRAEEIKDTAQYEDVMALTSTIEGHELAKKEQIKDICSSLVYTDLILEVVQRLKQGQTTQEIQASLDQRFSFRSNPKRSSEYL